MLDRDEDMAMSGTRHPFYAKNKVGESQSIFFVSPVSSMEETKGLSITLFRHTFYAPLFAHFFCHNNYCFYIF